MGQLAECNHTEKTDNSGAETPVTVPRDTMAPPTKNQVETKNTQTVAQGRRKKALAVRSRGNMRVFNNDTKRNATSSDDTTCDPNTREARGALHYKPRRDNNRVT